MTVWYSSSGNLEIGCSQNFSGVWVCKKLFVELSRMSGEVGTTRHNIIVVQVALMVF